MFRTIDDRIQASYQWIFEWLHFRFGATRRSICNALMWANLVFLMFQVPSVGVPMLCVDAGINALATMVILGNMFWTTKGMGPVMAREPFFIFLKIISVVTFFLFFYVDMTSATYILLPGILGKVLMTVTNLRGASFVWFYLCDDDDRRLRRKKEERERAKLLNLVPVRT